MADDVRIDGLDELKRTLAGLPDRLGERVFRAALRSAAQVIRKDAMARVPVLAEPDPRRKPGTVRRAISVRRSKKDKFGVFVSVKPLGGKAIRAFKTAGGRSAANPDDPFYWIFLEFGTPSNPARPFMRPAFQAQAAAAVQKFAQFAAARAVKEAEKYAKQQGAKT